MEIRVEPLRDPGDVRELAAEAAAEGWHFVERLIEEWRSGANRFDARGEAMYVATDGGVIAGVGGLNADPYAADATVGRVRRLYVSPAFRRRGVGAALVEQILARARPTFAVLHLRTRNPQAIAFYEAIGFRRVEGDDSCTHRLELA